MDFTKTIKTLKLLLATVLVGTASLSANAYFYDGTSDMYFSVNDGGTTCSVIAKPAGKGRYTGDIVNALNGYI